MCFKINELSPLSRKHLYHMDLRNLAQKVVAIAQRAGDAIQEIYHASEGIEIVKKADDSPLTIADRTANQIICEGLEQLTVKFPIISEENKEIPYTKRRHYTYCWLVDPLDGTKEFIKRNGEFTVNIALIHNSEVVLGVVYASDRNEMYWAARGEGAYEVVGGQNVKLTAKDFKMTDEGLKVVCSRSHLNDDTQAFVAALAKPELVATGSSLKFTIIAKGNAEVYPRLAPTMEWDTGAAQVILEEAGGRVINHETKGKLLYNKENLRNPHFVAYGRLISKWT